MHLLEQNDYHTHDLYISHDAQKNLLVVDFLKGKMSCFVGVKEKQGSHYTLIQ